MIWRGVTTASSGVDCGKRIGSKPAGGASPWGNIPLGPDVRVGPAHERLSGMFEPAAAEALAGE